MVRTALGRGRGDVGVVVVVAVAVIGRRNIVVAIGGSIQHVCCWRFVTSRLGVLGDVGGKQHPALSLAHGDRGDGRIRDEKSVSTVCRSTV